jgi:hypothetical protein
MNATSGSDSGLLYPRLFPLYRSQREGGDGKKPTVITKLNNILRKKTG